MVTFEQSLSALVQRNLISYDDALARSLYPKDIATVPPAQVGVIGMKLRGRHQAEEAAPDAAAGAGRQPGHRRTSRSARAAAGWAS